MTFWFSPAFNRFEMCALCLALILTPNTWLGLLEFVGIMLVAMTISVFCEAYLETR